MVLEHFLHFDACLRGWVGGSWNSFKYVVGRSEVESVRFEKARGRQIHFLYCASSRQAAAPNPTSLC